MPGNIVREVDIGSKYTQRPMKFLLPTSCIGCKKFQINSICDKCLKSIKDQQIHRCVQCALPCANHRVICDFCIRQPPAFNSTRCIDTYGGLLTEAIHDYKYSKKVALAKCFADVWENVWQRELNTEPTIDWMIPVPLSLEKLHARGFNQSWELCRYLSKRFKIKSDHQILKRKHISGDQAHATREERLTRLINTFSVNPKRLSHIEQKNILIVDDVMTTGATLNIMAKLLKDFGAQSVHNWVILRTSL